LFGETEIGMNLNALLAAHFMAGEADKRNWSVIGLEQRVKRAIAYAETLIERRSYLVGDDLTLADISVCCGLGIWQGALGGALPDGLSAYQDRLRARPAYQRARTRCAGQRARLFAAPALRWETDTGKHGRRTMADVAEKTVSVTRLHPVIGAEIRGVDLSRPLDDATLREIKQAWYAHTVLVFRNQTLSEDDQR